MIDYSTTEIHSPEWFEKTFSDRFCTAPEWCQHAAAEICKLANIRGICDPPYIANAIAQAFDQGEDCEYIHKKLTRAYLNMPAFDQMADIIMSWFGKGRTSAFQEIEVIQLRELVITDPLLDNRQIYVGRRSDLESGRISDALDNEIYFYCEDELFAKGSDAEIVAAFDDPEVKLA